MRISEGPWENTVIHFGVAQTPKVLAQYRHLTQQRDQFNRLWKVVCGQPGGLFSIRVTRGILQGDLTVHVSIGPYHLGGHIMWNNENQLEIPAYSHINPEGVEVWEQLKFGPAVQIELAEGSSASANRGPRCIIGVRIVSGPVTLLNARTPHDRLEVVTHSANRMVIRDLGAPLGLRTVYGVIDTSNCPIPFDICFDARFIRRTAIDCAHLIPIYLPVMGAPRSWYGPTSIMGRAHKAEASGRDPDFSFRFEPDPLASEDTLGATTVDPPQPTSSTVETSSETVPFQPEDRKGKGKAVEKQPTWT